MAPRFAIALSTLLLAGLASSCAVSGGPDGAPPTAYAPRPSVPARVGLPSMYRPFFDELRDEGDWTLIEPYGWCFRPRVNYVAWRPYLEGWWEPSDSWGWIWNTNEPFGWITYHYGTWFYDSYQGWVWQPGPVWGPAWVAWVEVGDYAGWAPLAPSEWSGYSNVPGGMFTFSDMRQLASRDVGQQALYLTTLPETNAPVHEITNVGHTDGIAFNRGPDFARLERLGAPLPERADPATLHHVRLGSTVARPNEAELRVRTGRLAAEAVREWRALRERGVAPPPAPPGGRRGSPAPPPKPSEPDDKPGRRPEVPGEHPRPHSHEPAAGDSTGSGGRRSRPAQPDSTLDR